MSAKYGGRLIIGGLLAGIVLAVLAEQGNSGAREQTCETTAAQLAEPSCYAHEWWWLGPG